MGQAVDPRPEATRLGSYEILRKIARGGMAELFLARTVGPEGFEKLVVLKKILPNFAENPKFVRLFLDEAKLAATLDHPHIAHVYDMGKVDGNYFFTMEYVHGQDVRTTLRRTARTEVKFPIDHAVQIIHAVASALHYAHERRKPDGTLLDIVHRDVSPSNILISYDGGIKLVDFGVAKAATSSVKTRTGTLKGKIAYMSPEQAKGSPIDRRSDIFSLGIVLWEMVTTSRLFKGDNDLATIQLIVNSKPPPPRELRPECPEELERIILKALAADLDQRYSTAEELQLDLEEFAREHKLKQSTVALRAHMQDLFAEEIKAWMHAQASGITLTDHVVSASVVEMTTPVSENEVSFLSDDDEEDDDSIHPTQGAITAMRAPTDSALPIAAQPSVMVGRIDHTPVPVPMVSSATGPVHVIQHTPSGPIRAVTPPPMVIHSPSGPIAMPPAMSPGMTAFPPEQPSSAGFPIAPREWRDASSPEMDARRQQRTQRLVIAGLLGLATITVIALASGGSGGTARSATELRPEPVETTRPGDPDTTKPADPPATPKASDVLKAGSDPTDTNATTPRTGDGDATKASETPTNKTGDATKASDTTTTNKTGDATKASDTTKAPSMTRTGDATKATTKPGDATKDGDATKAIDSARTPTRPADATKTTRTTTTPAKPADATKPDPHHHHATTTTTTTTRPADTTKPADKKKPDATKKPADSHPTSPPAYDPNSALPPP